MGELMGCPFCGGEAELIGYNARENRCVRCNGCGIVVEREAGHFTNEQAVAAWNKRAGGWVPVGERLPEQDGIYLTHTPCSWPVQAANFVSDKNGHVFATMNYGGILGGVTHWRELPSAPRV